MCAPLSSRRAIAAIISRVSWSTGLNGSFELPQVQNHCSAASLLKLVRPADAGTTCLRAPPARHATCWAAEAGTCRGHGDGQACYLHDCTALKSTDGAELALTLPAPGRMSSPHRGWCGLQLAERCTRLHRCPAPVSYLGLAVAPGQGKWRP